MYLPDDLTVLGAMCADMITQAFASADDRRRLYEERRNYFLYGTQSGDLADYNRIWSHIDALTSFLFSGETCKFFVSANGGKVDPKFQPVVTRMAALMSDEVDRAFHENSIDDIATDAIMWSLVFDTMIIKMRWNSVLKTMDAFLVEPHNFGVANEAITHLPRQPFMVHRYAMPADELFTRLSGVYGPAEAIEKFRRVSTHAPGVTQMTALPTAVNRMILTATNPTMIGAVNPNLSMPPLYKPHVGQSQVEMYEIWVQDDAAHDWRCITVASPDVVLYGRKGMGNIFLPRETPFVNVTPNPLYDYFWGVSELTALLKLQDWSNLRISQIKELLNLQINPPMSFSGFDGLQDEKKAAASLAGSWFTSAIPGAEAKSLAPQIPGDIFTEIQQIGRFFEEASGLTGLLQGRNDTGVRSKEQVSSLAKLGSSRIRKKALRIERPIEKIGDNIMGLLTKHDDTTHRIELPGGREEPFIAAQLGEDWSVKVDGHSASPIFVDDHHQLAFALAKLQAIDAESVLDLTNPPMLDILKARLKERQKAQAEAIRQNPELAQPHAAQQRGR